MASGPQWPLCIWSLPPAMACGGGVAWGRAGVRQGGSRSRVASTQAKTSQAAAWHLLERPFGLEQGPAQCGNELPDQRPQPPPALPHMTHLDFLQRLSGGKALRWHGNAGAGAMRGRAAVASSREGPTPKTQLAPKLARLTIHSQVFNSSVLRTLTHMHMHISRPSGIRGPVLRLPPTPARSQTMVCHPPQHAAPRASWHDSH